MLGAGLGLLSVASIVGAQSTVSWGQRGVVTGTVMFTRYLGQSLGAAIFGAIFNAAIGGKLHGAPAALRHRLPDQVSGVATALARPQELGRAAEDYLRAAIATATTHVYAGLTVVAVLTIAGALLIMPKHFSTSAGESASTGPGQASPAGASTDEASQGEPGRAGWGPGGRGWRRPGGKNGVTIPGQVAMLLGSCANSHAIEVMTHALGQRDAARPAARSRPDPHCRARTAGHRPRSGPR